MDGEEEIMDQEGLGGMKNGRVGLKREYEEEITIWKTFENVI